MSRADVIVTLIFLPVFLFSLNYVTDHSPDNRFDEYRIGRDGVIYLVGTPLFSDQETEKYAVPRFQPTEAMLGAGNISVECARQRKAMVNTFLSRLEQHTGHVYGRVPDGRELVSPGLTSGYKFWGTMCWVSVFVLFGSFPPFRWFVFLIISVALMGKLSRND